MKIAISETSRKNALAGLRLLQDSLKKFDPREQFKNPVMFLVYLGSVFLSLLWLQDALRGAANVFNGAIALWLWFTVWFANLAESIAEGRSRARADSLRSISVSAQAKRLRDDGSLETVPANRLLKGERFVCAAGDVIPADGEILEGAAAIDESAITGESAPVVREGGGDRSGVTAGTRVLSDSFVARVSQDPGGSFLDRMIALVEGAKRQKTPNEIALTIVLAAFSLIFLLATLTLKPLYDYTVRESGVGAGELSLFALIALLVCLIPTTIAGLLSAIRVSGMNRLLKFNVVALSGRAIEAAGDVDLLLLDKTGTITLGARQATEFIPAPEVSPADMTAAAARASLDDPTPEGRSIVALARRLGDFSERPSAALAARFVEFSARLRMSGVDYDLPGGVVQRVRKGAPDAVERFVAEQGGRVGDSVRRDVERIARQGGTPLLVAADAHVLGAVYLKDVIKPNIKERFARLRSMGVRTVMITGDNPLTAAAIAAESGVDDFMAEATPEAKLERIRKEQSGGRLVAMTGDGTNDAPALAQADVGVAMNAGTQAAREAGNMVDLDSDPAKLIEIVETGKQILMTRGALTTFSIANDVAKYFAILPALFGGLYAAQGAPGPLAKLNLMNLASPESAILSAVIFNALIIVALIPLALRGTRYRPMGGAALLRRNLLVYGLGGLVVPFIGIKLIDLVVRTLV